MASMNVRSGDLVEVIVGGVEVRGKRGRVMVVNPDEGTVVVENLNLVTRHRKPRSAQEQGGKFEKPRAIDVSNVMLVCPKCNKATRVGHVQVEGSTKFVRVCKQCNAVIDTKTEKKQTKAAANKKKNAAKKES